MVPLSSFRLAALAAMVVFVIVVLFGKRPLVDSFPIRLQGSQPIGSEWTDQLPALSTFGYIGDGVERDYVLVLGAGGVVGRALVQELRNNNYNVLSVENRVHLDLREPRAMEVFTPLADSRRIIAVYFLACEVGGSKYLTSGGNVQQRIWGMNEAMYAEVLGFLHRYPSIKVIFSSSQLSDQPTSYGRMKLRGEQLLKELIPNGRSLYFWNVVGGEPLGTKSHVLSDWAFQCLQKGEVKSLTSGEEVRQYIHADEAAVGLRLMLEKFEVLEQVTHITNGVWSSLKDLAVALDAATEGGCKISFTQPVAEAMVRAGPKRREPNINAPFFQYWKPDMSLQETARRSLEYYRKTGVKQGGYFASNPYLTVVVRGSTEKRFRDWIESWEKAASMLAVNPSDLELILVDAPAAYCEGKRYVCQPSSGGKHSSESVSYRDLAVIGLGRGSAPYLLVISQWKASVPTYEALSQLMKRQLNPNSIYLTQVAKTNSPCPNHQIARRRVFGVDCNNRHQRLARSVCATLPNAYLPGARLDKSIGETFGDIGRGEHEAKTGTHLANSDICDFVPEWTLAHRRLWENVIWPSSLLTKNLGVETINMPPLTEWRATISALATFSKPCASVAVLEHRWESLEDGKDQTSTVLEESNAGVEQLQRLVCSASSVAYNMGESSLGAQAAVWRINAKGGDADTLRSV